MNIFIDMDNTACNFIKAFAEKCNELFKTGFDYDSERENWESRWEITKSLFPGATAENKRNIHLEVFNSPGFWLDMEPMPNAIESIHEISQDNNVYILTAPYPQAISCWIEKYYWVKKNLPFISPENIIYCNNKSLLKSDIMIDDKPEYLLKNQFTFSIAYEYEFNSHLRYAVDFMSNSWPDIAKFLTRINNENRV